MAISIKDKDAWVERADCSKCQSHEHVLFAELAASDFENISCPIDKYSYRQGRTIYKKGDKGDSLYTMRSGLIKLERYLPDGNRRIVRLVKPNDIFGMEVLVNDTYEHNAVVLESTELCKILVSTIDEIGKNNPMFCHKIISRWQDTLNEADHWLTDLLSGTAKQRVARLLMMLCKENNTCSLLSRDDMGSLLSITTETTSRIIAEFKRSDILKDVGGGQFFCDCEQLNQLAFK